MLLTWGDTDILDSYRFAGRSNFQVSHSTLFLYTRPRVDIPEVPAVSHADAVPLVDTIGTTLTALTGHDPRQWEP